MKNDVVLYERIYQLLKNQIKCGVLPVGAKLPSRKELCKEFQVSEKTIRRVLELLAERKLIETQQRKRPVVKPSAAENECGAPCPADGTAIPKEMFGTGRLLCYPAIEKGVSLCTGEDWEIPTAIVEQMDPSRGTEFWLLSHRFWRFFIARNGNDLLLRAVDGLGFSSLEPLPGSLELREAYLKTLREYVQPKGRDGRQAKPFFENLARLYGVADGRSENESREEPRYKVAPDSPLFTGSMDLEQRLRSAEERYSRVYMDLMGLITIGRYQPGDRLPSHKKLQKIYDVSSDTTTKAIHVLQEWGVVRTKRGDGIYVAMDLAGLKNAEIAPELIGCHLRRFMDSMEVLDITIDGVAAHAAASISAEEAGGFRMKMDRLWNEEYLYQLTPMALLEFISEHIRYPHLKEIYRVLSKNYHIGRSIPKLVTHEKTIQNAEIHKQGLEAVESLVRGDRARFSEKAAAMFRYVHELVVRECKRLGYWEIAENVYDGAILWRKSNFVSKDERTRRQPAGAGISSGKKKVPGRCGFEAHTL